MTAMRQVYKVGARIHQELTVLGVVDKGGREPVYIVWHHREWCPMACKIFRSFRRADREADVLAKFTHPNIVRFLGLEKPAFLLTEFLDGPTLRRIIRDQPSKRLGVSDAVRVAIHVGAALAHVHVRGFLHLDVKPSNIIIARGGRPILFDFGTARLQGGRRPPDIQGTDPYIAPEECSRESVTPAADVFALAVTLYEMLTGELPFGEGTRKHPFPQTKVPPVPLRSRRPNVPASLDNLVLSCLAVDPDSRPKIAELLPSLHDFIRRGPQMWPPDFRPDGSARGAIRD